MQSFNKCLLLYWTIFMHEECDFWGDVLLFCFFFFLQTFHYRNTCHSLSYSHRKSSGIAFSLNPSAAIFPFKTVLILQSKLNMQWVGNFHLEVLVNWSDSQVFQNNCTVYSSWRTYEGLSHRVLGLVFSKFRKSVLDWDT